MATFPVRRHYLMSFVDSPSLLFIALEKDWFSAELGGERSPSRQLFFLLLATPGTGQLGSCS